MAKAFQAPRPWVRGLRGSVGALNDIEKGFNETVKRNLGSGYRGVLRDYDYMNPKSKPIITGDMRDTTYFVVLKNGKVVAAQSLLFEAE